MTLVSYVSTQVSKTDKQKSMHFASMLWFFTVLLCGLSLNIICGFWLALQNHDCSLSTDRPNGLSSWTVCLECSTLLVQILTGSYQNVSKMIIISIILSAQQEENGRKKMLASSLRMPLVTALMRISLSLSGNGCWSPAVYPLSWLSLTKD